MAQDINRVDLLVRREIEALIAAPLLRAFMESFGAEAALEAARTVVEGLAFESGKTLKMAAGGDTMDHLKRVLSLFGQGGALELDVLEESDGRLAANVTRCRYAEMYRTHGLEEFGFLLSCRRDYAMLRGFNPRIEFSRTHTIMEGAEYCDFRFSISPSAPCAGGP